MTSFARPWRRTALVLLLTAATLGLSATAAHADDPIKRAVPNYDGRGERPTTVAEDMLWIPRVVLSPLYLVSEFVLRRPLVFIVGEAERLGVIDDVSGFLNGNIGIVPTFLFDFGLSAGALPSGGFYFWWDNLGVKNHRIRLRAAFAEDVIGSIWTSRTATPSATTSNTKSR